MRRIVRCLGLALVAFGGQRARMLFDSFRACPNGQRQKRGQVNSKRVGNLVGLGVALVLLAWAAGNSGQVGLAQEGVPPVRTLGFGGVLSVAFSPDGRYLAALTYGSVQLIDTNGWQVVRTFEGNLVSVAFSPDGRLLASVGFLMSGNSGFKLWDVATGKEVRTLRLGYCCYTFYSVAFSPDGTLLAAGVGGDIGLWEVATGKEVRTLEGHTGYVYSVAFSPDGKLLASTSGGGLSGCGT